MSDVSNERLRGVGCLGVSMNIWEYDGSSEERWEDKVSTSWASSTANIDGAASRPVLGPSHSS